MQQLIVAVNRLKDEIRELVSQVESLSKSPSQQLSQKYLDNEAACAILHVSGRTLYKLRSDGEIPFIRVRRKIIYQASDIHQYIEDKLRKRQLLFKRKDL